MKSLIASISILFFASLAHADAPPVYLFDGKEIYHIGFNMDILEDPTGKLTIDEVNRLEGKFKKSRDKVPNFGFSTSAFWIQVMVNNKSLKKDWLFSYNYYNILCNVILSIRRRIILYILHILVLRIFYSIMFKKY